MTGPATTIRPAQPSVVTPSSAPPIGALLADLTWPEVEARLARGAAAVLPLGAACKEHGRHLPMGADALHAEWLSRRLAERADVLVWPVLGYGHYPAFIDYPGSCSLSPETFRSLVREILQDILRHGTRLAVVLNTGISTIAPLERAAADLPARDRVVLMHVYRGPRYADARRRWERQTTGGHADELETSIMLAIAPEAVRLELARPWVGKPWQPGPLNRDDPNQPNYAPDGVYGDPTLATREKGEALLEAMMTDLVLVLTSSLAPPPA